VSIPEAAKNLFRLSNTFIFSRGEQAPWPFLTIPSVLIDRDFHQVFSYQLVVSVYGTTEITSKLLKREELLSMVARMPP